VPGTLGLILFWTTLGSIASLGVAAILTVWPKILERFYLYLVSFAAGALIGASLFDLLPEAIEHFAERGLGAEEAFFFAAIGIVVFFLLEKVVMWYHNHTNHGHSKQVTAPVVPLILFGDGLHNFIDGAVIAAAFLTDPGLGILAAIAVFLHEIPQEIGDFSVLLYTGMKRAKALFYNFLSAVTALAGALTTFYVAGGIEAITVPMVAITAGAFLFIANAELIPEIVHREKGGVPPFLHAVTFILGLFVIRYLQNAVGIAH
jgi:zinc and cadmium transporter